MRVNHVGEICAQALYSAGALATNNLATKKHFLAASVMSLQLRKRLKTLLHSMVLSHNLPMLLYVIMKEDQNRMQVEELFLRLHQKLGWAN